MKTRGFISLFICLLGLFFSPASAQLLHGYEFHTGVNSFRWYNLTNPITLLDGSSATLYSSPEISTGFNFWMMGEDVVSFSVHRNGRMYLNRSYNAYDYNPTPMRESYVQNYISPYGVLSGWDSTASVVYQILGSPGNRILVCEFAIKSNAYSTALSRYQIQLEEYSCAIRIVYAPCNDNSSGPSGEIGFAKDNNHYILVHPSYHVAAANGNFPTMPANLPWPGGYRYYEFSPACAGMIRIVTDSIWRTRARVRWDRFPQHEHYLVEYGLAGFPNGVRNHIQTDNDTLWLTGLTHSTQYEVRVRAVCHSGDTSEPISGTFTTIIQYPCCSNIPFTDFYDPNVVCRTGIFSNTDQYVQIIDHGSASMLSRHTVHCNTTELDPHTDNQLHTIPPGHCSSVRLGNWGIGAQQESITYTLHIDTNDYDLLILRYAVVAQDPNHPPDEQPYFTLSINDSAGRYIDDCHYANFVSGDASNWNRINNILWHNWDVVGVNLTPFHGQRIQVKLSNADCSVGGHYGYAYFTLEGGTKHLSTTLCGPNSENTFYAPEGFDYRWYNTNNPSATLSTSRSLHVTTEGLYECRASYRLSGNNCGFTMSTRAGPRYPVAQFHLSYLTYCGSSIRFVNESVIATDSAHTQLTDEPCEQYLWRFDDGSTDTTENPVHTFTNGAHSATLVAMLADGRCMDSVTQYFIVNMSSDTLRTTVCQGTAVPYRDTYITDSGTYTFIENCTQHTVKVRYHPAAIGVLKDTICPAGEVVIGTDHFNQRGDYTVTSPWPDQYGCDSVIHLNLTVLYRESSEDVYDTICEGGYVEYHGTTYSQPGRELLDTVYSSKGCPTIRTLDLTVHPSYNDTLRDTLEAGHLFAFADTLLPAPGIHSLRFQTQYGCDSLWQIYLSCLRTIDTTVCVTAMPLAWNGHLFTKADTLHDAFRSAVGTDSLIDHIVHVRPKALAHPTVDFGCSPHPHYILSLPAGYRHQWRSSPADAAIAEITNDSLWQLWLTPTRQVRYIFTTDYTDAPSCPGKDSVTLSPGGFFNLDMKVTPSELTPDHLLLTAAESGKQVLSRQWYIDSAFYAEDSKSITYEASPKADSVLVTLIGGNGDCTDTVSRAIPVRRYDLYFPNIFTPGLDNNNLFLAWGDAITGFELWIYDRRGILLFHTTDMQEGWNGTANGVPCRQEAYTYACRFRVKDSGWNTTAGTVVLIR